ncbi:hypothetical protein EDC01DRAFT_753066 [Geopyxis carbonaria]|nr:hypothetical protein EDC01DRAFT_753066 [Geopyxis carbonaria]
MDPDIPSPIPGSINLNTLAEPDVRSSASVEPQAFQTPTSELPPRDTANPYPIPQSNTLPIVNDEALYQPFLSDYDYDDGDHSDGGCSLSDASDANNSIFTAANKPTKTQKLRRLRDKTVSAISRGLHTDAGAAERHKPHDADDASSLHSSSSGGGGGGVLNSVSRAIAHPRTALKQKATGTVASSVAKVANVTNPTVSRDSDVAFVAAHERRACARDGDEAADAERSIRALKRRRRDMRMGLIIGEQVHAVRAVPLRRRERWPAKEEFLVRDLKGEVLHDELGNPQVDYVLWAGQALLFLTQDFTTHYIEPQQPQPLDTHVLRTHIGRIFVASGPWQQWALHIRAVYRWDDPLETARWLALYALLWYTQHVVAFVYFYVLAASLWHYVFPSTVSDLAAANARARSRSAAALRLDQLIEQRGAGDWLPADLGATLQMQLGDVASFLEIANNFADWQSPRLTAYSLFFVGVCFVISLAGSMEFCMRIIFLILGLTFFGCFPVSSRYPQYRLLVNPLKWALWNIPTNAEWAFAELRLAAQAKRERAVASAATNTSTSTLPAGERAALVADQIHVNADEDADSFVTAAAHPLDPIANPHDPAPVSVSVPSDIPLATFPLHGLGRHGELTLTPAGIAAPGWMHTWEELVEVRKTRPALKRGVLEMVFEVDVDVVGEGEGEGEIRNGEGHGLGERLGEVKGEGEIRNGEGDGDVDGGLRKREVVRTVKGLGVRRDEAFASLVGFSRRRWQWVG